MREAVSAADEASYRVNSVINKAQAARQAAGVAQLAAQREADRCKNLSDKRKLERAEEVARRAVQRAEQLARQADATYEQREATRAARLSVRGLWYHIQGQTGGELCFQQVVEAAVEAAGEPSKAQKNLCCLLRDIFGYPLRAKPAINTAWPAWHDGTIVRIAQTIYEERSLPSGHLDPARLAILADACS